MSTQNGVVFALARLDKQCLELILGFWRLGAVVQGSVIQDDAHPALCSELKQNVNQIGFVQIVGEHIQVQGTVAHHLVEQRKEFFSRGEAQPLVFVSEGV